jgi:uncharacterized protein
MNAADLLQVIKADPGLRHVLAAVASHEAADPGHDLAHSLRVALWMLRLGGVDIDQREHFAAALLHDAVNLPKNSPQRADASVLSAELASEILLAAGFHGDTVVAISEANA